MKTIKKLKVCLLLAGGLTLAFASCRKDTNGKFSGTGAPVISSIRTVNKTVNDTTPKTVITYDTTGVASTVTNPNTTVVIAPFDSTTASGNLDHTYAILGQNLGSTTKITLNGLSIYFNRALNSDNVVIFTIPEETPYGPGASNKLVLTTLHGSVTYNFTVLSPPPTIQTLSDYDFTGGGTLTLKGKGFSTVTTINLKGTSDNATIVSQSDTVLKLKMPTTAAAIAPLVFTYQGGKVTTTQQFVDLDNAYTIFANNNFQNGWGDASWSGPSGVSTNASKSGTASAEATYPAGGWKIEGWANWWPGFTYSPDYKYLTFWVKGGTVPHTLTLVGDKMAGGYSQNTTPAAIQQIVVPANVWSYYLIPIGTGANQLNYWATGNTANQLGFFLLGQSNDVDETYYFDEVAFVK